MQETTHRIIQQHGPINVHMKWILSAMAMKPHKFGHTRQQTSLMEEELQKQVLKSNDHVIFYSALPENIIDVKSTEG